MTLQQNVGYKDDEGADAAPEAGKGKKKRRRSQ